MVHNSELQAMAIPGILDLQSATATSSLGTDLPATNIFGDITTTTTITQTTTITADLSWTRTFAKRRKLSVAKSAKPAKRIKTTNHKPLPRGWHSVNLSQINDLISCKLCRGYLIDATTITECLHSFCRKCLVIHLKNISNSCPKCSISLPGAKPFENIRSDPTLQEIVYKLVPNLFTNEMKRRKRFYKNAPPEVLVNLTSEERGDVRYGHPVYGPNDTVFITLVSKPYWKPFKPKRTITNTTPSDNKNCEEERIYLKCPGTVSVANLKKLLTMRYELQACHTIDILYEDDILSDNCPMIDLVYSNSWMQTAPLCLHFKITKI